MKKAPIKKSALSSVVNVEKIPEALPTSTESIGVTTVSPSEKRPLIPPRKKPNLEKIGVAPSVVSSFPEHSRAIGEETPKATTAAYAPRVYNWHPKLQPGTPEAIAELINRRRHQLIVHSTVYYRLNQNIIEDQVFDQWSRELVALQAAYPDIAESLEWADLFRGFDGSTGFHLSGEPWGWGKAQQLLRTRPSA